jgi:hypothetical protein
MHEVLCDDRESGGGKMDGYATHSPLPPHQ